MDARLDHNDAPDAGPLDTDEVRLAERALRRLHEQFRAFLRIMPESARNASGLARHLDVDRTTCQRLVYLATRPYAGLGMIDRLPGVRGLRTLIRAARRRDPRADAETLDALEAAVERLDETFRRLGGSQSALIRRLAATPMARLGGSASDSSNPHETRRKLFEAACELTGRQSETWVAIYVYTPGAGGVDVARVHGLIGHQARGDAVPLTFHNFTSREEAEGRETEQSFESITPHANGRAGPINVLDEFSTRPPPLVSTRQPGQYLVQTIDTDPDAEDTGVDLVFGTRSRIPHPASQPPGIEEVWAMINFPARRMLFDVYLHRDLARACIPSLDTHLWRPDFAAHVGDRWQTRFTETPRLELLGPGLANAASSLYSRHGDLTRHLFGGIGGAPGQYVGFRCRVDYPAWRTGYCMSFDFNPASDDDAD